MLRKPRSITIRSRWSNPILMLYIIIGRCNAKKNLGTSLPHAHDDDHLHSASRVVKRKRPLVPWLKGFSRWLPSRWALNGKHELFPTHTRGFVFCTNLWRLKKTRLCIYPSRCLGLRYVVLQLPISLVREVRAGTYTIIFIMYCKI